MKQNLKSKLTLCILLLLMMQLGFKGYAQTTPICVNSTTKLNSALPSGGTMSNVNGYTIHIFNSSGQLIVPNNFTATAELLIVAGGGGGGYRHAGGGGAGGLIHTFSYFLHNNQSVIVGNGGAGATGDGSVAAYSTSSNSGVNGGQSNIDGLVAIGGGGGGNNNKIGQAGGSGGGGSNGSLGGPGTVNQGNKGGDQTGNIVPYGAGGGGYNTAGLNAATEGSGGGAGALFEISGKSTFYAGGGGGGQGFVSNTTAFATYPGGVGGGGDGGTPNNINGINGDSNTGGGGGGGGAANTIYNNNSGIGGSGGSGVVVIRYLQPTITWTSSNTAVATVDASGLVTGISAGTANITNTITSGTNISRNVIIVTVSSLTAPVITTTSTSNNSTSSCNGNPVILSSNAGNALQFNGSNYAESNNPAMPLGNASRTMEAWIKTSSNNNGVFVNYGTLTQNERSGLLMVDRKLYFVGEVNDVIGNIIINDNVWHHVAVVYNGTLISLYIDGNLDVAKSISAINTTGTTVRIAKRLVGDNGVENFIGTIDEIRIWNIAKTQQQLQASMNYSVDSKSNGLVAYYKMDDAAGSTITDASVNNITSNLIGSPLTVISNAPINNYTSYLWSNGGTTSSISVNNSSNISLTVQNTNGCKSVPSVITVTINSAPLATMTAPAANIITVACGASPSSSQLTLSDGKLSDKSTFTAVAGTCGGTLTETWTATDLCERTLAPVSRTVTISQNLGAVQNFVLFSGIGAVSNTGNSTVTGDVGSNLGAVSGFDAPSTLIGGSYSATSPTTQIKIDLLNLYIHLSNISVTNTTHAAVFGSNETITAGVYTIPSAGSMAGNLNLDAQNNANAIFILKFEGAFSPAAGSSTTLLNGASAANVFWIAEGAISIGASSTMKGTFIAHTGAATMAAGGDLEGRLLSTVGAVSFGPGVAKLPTDISAIPVICVNTCDNTILKSAGNFTLFTSAGAVSNIGSSGIIGNVGSNAGAITGFETSATTLMGNTNNADDVTAQAATDLLAGYTALVNTTATNSAHAPAFGNETLTPGVYEIGGAGSLAGTLILDGTGVTNPTFIFKFGGAFSVGAQSKVILKNVSHCNVYWVAEGAISIGTFSFMKGSFIANNGANSMGANGNLEGSLFSTAGAIGFNTGVGYISYLNCTNTPSASSNIRVLKMDNILKSNLSTENKLSVYPNPARGIINMAFTGDASKVTSVEIVDALGKLVYSSKHFQSIINLSNKTAGVYFLRVHLNSSITTTKIIMEK